MARELSKIPSTLLFSLKRESNPSKFCEYFIRPHQILCICMKEVIGSTTFISVLFNLYRVWAVSVFLVYSITNTREYNLIYTK